MYPHEGDVDRSSNPQDGAARFWASKAKEQVLQLLAVASLETVKTLLLIAWYEFGQDRDTVSRFHSVLKTSTDTRVGLVDVSLQQTGGPLSLKLTTRLKVFRHEFSHGDRPRYVRTRRSLEKRCRLSA